MKLDIFDIEGRAFYAAIVWPYKGDGVEECYSTLKGHALEEIKTKAWRLAIDNAIKFANGRDIDNVYINVTLEYGTKYFDSDDLFGAIRDGEFIYE